MSANMYYIFFIYYDPSAWLVKSFKMHSVWAVCTTSIHSKVVIKTQSYLTMLNHVNGNPMPECVPHQHFLIKYWDIRHIHVGTVFKEWFSHIVKFL